MSVCLTERVDELQCEQFRKVYSFDNTDISVQIPSTRKVAGILKKNTELQNDNNYNKCMEYEPTYMHLYLLYNHIKEIVQQALFQVWLVIQINLN